MKNPINLVLKLYLFFYRFCEQCNLTFETSLVSKQHIFKQEGFFKIKRCNPQHIPATRTFAGISKATQKLNTQSSARTATLTYAHPFVFHRVELIYFGGIVVTGRRENVLCRMPHHLFHVLGVGVQYRGAFETGRAIVLYRPYPHRLVATTAGQVTTGYGPRDRLHFVFVSLQSHVALEFAVRLFALARPNRDRRIEAGRREVRAARRPTYRPDGPLVTVRQHRFQLQANWFAAGLLCAADGPQSYGFVFAARRQSSTVRAPTDRPNASSVPA